MKVNVKREGLLLEYLEECSGLTRKKIKMYLKNGCIYVDGVKTTKYDYPLFIGSIVNIETKNGLVVNLPFEIIYEDENIIVVSKPAGLLTIATQKEKEQTLYHLVGEYLRKRNRGAKVFIVHRLDKDTSGVVVLAKNEHAKNILQKNWDKYVNARSYIAIVHGNVEKKEDTLINYLKETSTNLVYISKNSEGKKAITKYKVLKQKNDYTKLQINIETGRKNQIRVQLANIGHPILGDKKYGDDKQKRLFLHADRLELYNPILKKNMVFKSNVPNIFNHYL